jgi:hypothetical protein
MPAPAQQNCCLSLAEHKLLRPFPQAGQLVLFRCCQPVILIAIQQFIVAL